MLRHLRQNQSPRRPGNDRPKHQQAKSQCASRHACPLQTSLLMFCRSLMICFWPSTRSKINISLAPLRSPRFQCCQGQGALCLELNMFTTSKATCFQHFIIIWTSWEVPFMECHKAGLSATDVFQAEPMDFRQQRKHTNCMCPIFPWKALATRLSGITPL